MKTRKSYRLSPRAIRALEELHDNLLKGWTETDIVEAALESLLTIERQAATVKARDAAEIRRAAEEEGLNLYPNDILAEAWDLPGYDDGNMDY